MSLPASLQFEGLEDYLRVEHAAMATSFTFHLLVDPEAGAAQTRAAAAEAFRAIDQVEEQLSFYRESSDVSRINRAAAGQTVRVSEATMHCLLTALEVADASGGAFDPFAGAPALAAKGQPIPAHLRDCAADDPPGTPCVAVDPSSSTIVKLEGRRWLDLGAVGKGHALDVAATVLQEWGVPAGLLVAGGSSIVAFGAGPGEGGAWTLRLIGSEGARTLHLPAPFGLGASGEGFQPGHIVRTALTTLASPWRAYALAPNGALADALSTALWALPADARNELTAPWPEASILVEPRRDEQQRLQPIQGSGVFVETAPAGPACILVVPCWRESRRLPGFLPSLAARVSASPFTIEIVVVDDGSEPAEADATAALIEQWRASHPRLRPLVRLPRHTGKGAAIVRGWREAPAGCAWVAFVDADGSVPANEVVGLIEVALRNPGPPRVLAASRRHRDPARPVERAGRRAWIGEAFARWSAWRLRHGAADPQCGCKVLPAALARDTPWREAGYALDLELLLSARHRGLRVEDHPIAWRETPGSKLRARDLFSMLQSVERLRITARACPARPPASSSLTPP